MPHSLHLTPRHPLTPQPTRLALPLEEVSNRKTVVEGDGGVVGAVSEEDREG